MEHFRLGGLAGRRWVVYRKRRGRRPRERHGATSVSGAFVDGRLVLKRPVDDTSDRGSAPVQILQTWEELEMVHSETHYFFEFFAFFLHLASEKMSFSAILSAPQQGIRLYIFFQDFTYARKQLSAAVFCAECRLLRNSLFARTSVRIIVQCSKVPQKNR